MFCNESQLISGTLASGWRRSARGLRKVGADMSYMNGPAWHSSQSIAQRKKHVKTRVLQCPGRAAGQGFQRAGATTGCRWARTITVCRCNNQQGDRCCWLSLWQSLAQNLYLHSPAGFTEFCQTLLVVCLGAHKLPASVIIFLCREAHGHACCTARKPQRLAQMANICGGLEHRHQGRWHGAPARQRRLW